ncbi:hypothetical protein HMPREF9413_0209 [Paenibacillus sp. HGF7]|nr:hypothetical protein HMPREF9413_0209 [Paenibacillus sp. HGF7]
MPLGIFTGSGVPLLSREPARLALLRRACLAAPILPGIEHLGKGSARANRAQPVHTADGLNPK